MGKRQGGIGKRIKLQEQIFADVAFLPLLCRDGGGIAGLQRTFCGNRGGIGIAAAFAFPRSCGGGIGIAAAFAFPRSCGGGIGIVAAFAFPRSCGGGIGIVAGKADFAQGELHGIVLVMLLFILAQVGGHANIGMAGRWMRHAVRLARCGGFLSLHGEVFPWRGNS